MNKNIVDEFEILKSKKEFNNSDIVLLKQIAESNEIELKIELAEILAGKNDIKVNEIFLILLNDTDELVRINACDSAYNINSAEILDKLKEISINDKYIVRGYALLSIGDIAKKYEKESNLNFLENRLKREHSKWVKIVIYRSLYLLNKQNEYIDELLKNLNSNNYKIRCLVLNCINELIDDENNLKIKQKLSERLKIEKTNAVKSSINKILNNILN